MWCNGSPCEKNIMIVAVFEKMSFKLIFLIKIINLNFRKGGGNKRPGPGWQIFEK